MDNQNNDIQNLNPQNNNINTSNTVSELEVLEDDFSGNQNNIPNGSVNVEQVPNQNITMENSNPQILNQDATVSQPNLQTPNQPVAPQTPVFETIPDNNINVNEGSNKELINDLNTALNDGNSNSTTASEQVNNTSQPSEPQDNFNQVPVPPVATGKEKKKGSKNIIIILLLIIIIAGIGFGIYYFLNTAQDNVQSLSINTKEVRIELGEEIPNDISSYAEVNGYNIDNCSLDNSEISNDAVSAYKFYVTCGSTKEEGTAIVDDTVAPVVTVTDVTILPNSTVDAVDFIESCTDASKCSYKFADEDVLSSYLKTIGNYEVEIIASDGYNNKTNVTANLIVTNNAPVKYVTCTSKEKDVDEIYATLKESYKFGVDSNNKLYNAIKSSEFHFSDDNDYLNIKNSYHENTGIGGAIGKAVFYDNSNTTIIKENKTLAEINKEINLNMPDDINTIRTYLFMMDYTCE